MSNPYANLKDENGVLQDPFRIATQWCMPFPVAECLKKLLCPGLDGRKKNRLEDLEDALNTLELCLLRKDEFFWFKCLLFIKKPFLKNNIQKICKIYQISGDHEKSVACFLQWVLSGYSEYHWYCGCKTYLLNMIREIE